jgi:DNA-directed RNA polymerase subunit RPC12/RpoP
MITYRCDRCGAETTPDKLYEVELIFTPRTLNGDLDTDQEDRKTLGELCADCTDRVEPLVQALVKPPAADSSS